MRRFNPEKELKKIQHGNRNKIIFCVIALLIIIGISSSYALYQVRYSKRIIYTKVAPFSNHDIDLAVYIDGSPSSNGDFPDKNDGKIYDKIDCGETKVKAYWDYDKWALVLETSKKAKCTVYFKTGSSSSGTKPDTSGANPPELYDGLIPVKYDDSGNIIVVDKNSTDWYNYDAHEWANAVLVDNNKVVAADLSGNGNHGELVGGTKIGEEGLILDGNDDGIYLGDTLKDLFYHNNTIQVKLKRTETGRSTIIGNCGTSSSFLLNYEYDTKNSLRLWYNNGSPDVSTNVLEKSNEFVTLTYIYDSQNGTITVYQDSSQLYKSENNKFALSSLNYLNVYIGRDATQIGADSVALQGIIEKVMVYDDMLTTTEIQQNLNAASGKVGAGGIVSDNLHLYYDFKVPQNYDIIPGKILNMNIISQMYVWIPRYKYQLFNVNNYGIAEQMINVKFEHGTQSTGDVTCEISNKGEETCINAINGNWYTHPAFKFGNTDLKGIWVGKFETSDSEDISGFTLNNIGKISIIPNKISIVNKNVKIMFDATRKIENDFGLESSQIDTHMMKNIEWGAVTYLSQSKYGIYNFNSKDCTIDDCRIYINNTTNGSNSATNYRGTITGCSGSTANANIIYNVSSCNGYEWNTTNGIKASTTGNIYGIYDMSGGAWEDVMANMININGKFTTSASGFPENNPEIDQKYYDIYAYNTSPTIHNIGHLGDATRETLKIFGEEYGGWNNDWAQFLYGSSTWFNRGGVFHDGSASGIFATFMNDGKNYNECSFRVVLTAQDGNE